MWEVDLSWICYFWNLLGEQKSDALKINKKDLPILPKIGQNNGKDARKKIFHKNNSKWNGCKVEEIIELFVLKSILPFNSAYGWWQLTTRYKEYPLLLVALQNTKSDFVCLFEWTKENQNLCKVYAVMLCYSCILLGEEWTFQRSFL